MAKIRVCHNGHEVKKETDKDLKKEYPYYCPTCDENMYSMETSVIITEKKRKLKKISAIKTSGEATQIAIDWQGWASGHDLSYAELSEYQGYFEKLGRKFGLTAEFKENGII